MAKKLALVNGLPKMVDESGSTPIYEELLTIVSSGAVSGEINVNNAEAGDAITLPGGQTYEGDELEVYLNRDRLTVVDDYAYVGTGSKTQIMFTFDLEVGDLVKLRIGRAP